MNRGKIKKAQCKCCEQIVLYSDEDAMQDENSSYGSTKYIKCPLCHKICIVKVIEDSCDVNNDIRYYTYN